MNSIKKNWKKLLLTVVTMAIVFSANVFAADGQIQFKDPTVTRGKSVEVTLKVKQKTGSIKFQRANMSISYDPNMLEFESGTDAQGGAGTVSIDGHGINASTNTLTFNLKFKALQVGTANLTVLTHEIYDTSGNTVVISYVGGSKITIKPANRTSKNANLKTLEFNPGEISPEFNSEVIDYTTEVNSDVNSLVITAIPEDGDAKVTITGNENFVEGENNNVKVAVTAPNGTTVKTYTIHVSKLETGVTGGQTRVISGIRINSNPLRITYAEVPEGAYIEGYQPGVATIQNVGELSVLIPVGDNSVTPTTYLVYGFGENATEASWYRYDVIDNTLQRYYADPTNNSAALKAEIIDVQTNYNKLLSMYQIFFILLIVCVVVIVILIIVLISSSIKNRSKNNEDFYDDEDDDYYTNMRSDNRNNKANTQEDDYYDVDNSSQTSDNADDIEDLN